MMMYFSKQEQLIFFILMQQGSNNSHPRVNHSNQEVKQQLIQQMRKDVKLSAGEANYRKRGVSMPPKAILSSKEKREQFGIKLIRNLNNQFSKKYQGKDFEREGMSQMKQSVPPTIATSQNLNQGIITRLGSANKLCSITIMPSKRNIKMRVMSAQKRQTREIKKE